MNLLNMVSAFYLAEEIVERHLRTDPFSSPLFTLMRTLVRKGQYARILRLIPDLLNNVDLYRVSVGMYLLKYMLEWNVEVDHEMR